MDAMTRLETHPTGDLIVAALARGKERYVLMYEPAQRAEALRVIGRWASNADLDFSWFDAAQLAARIRKGE